ncbi:ABC transporter permease subunit [Actinoplanes couchii]|uniref:ABC transporter permease n=1 Tax=Actinoplanes couchii TaxID=403638 RepID=A0ABQ3X8B7_9ACTN|nr:ABC transporter permease subunit [Actinoplanes couchii]MDR6320225.1 ABC-type transport system involved in multi-copper enzyme maturation permease subunit [Actinoplanes couchii]GID54760.1 ABC transporter permease [Actinoplanes couchii]
MTFPQVIRFEWIKFRSLRSSWITLALTAGLYTGTGLLVCWLLFDPARAAVDDLVGKSLSGDLVALLAAGALGVLTMTGEYGSGTIRTTLAAVPRRWPVLAAKVVVLGTVSYAVMLLATVISFAAGQAIIGDLGASFGDDGVVRALFGHAAYVTGAGLFGLLFGGLLRSTAAAFTAYFAVMFLLTMLSALVLPYGWRVNVNKFLPSAAGEAMGSVVDNPELLTPGLGALVFAGYLLLTGTAAAWRLTRSDAG